MKEQVPSNLESKIPRLEGIFEKKIPVEATKYLSDKTRLSYPNVPWKDISGMRDKLIHGYFGVDIDAVWDTIQRDIPELKDNIERIIEDI